MPSLAPLPHVVEFCPCQSGKRYADCCKPFHDGAAAPSAELLMRSRFSAYALRLPAYLMSTWHAAQRPESIELEPEMQWRRLSILDASETGDRAVVEFRAHWRRKMERGIMHERSSFVREDGRWYYTTGIQM